MFFDPLNTIQTQNEAYYQLYLSVISTHYAIKPSLRAFTGRIYLVHSSAIIIRYPSIPVKNCSIISNMKIKIRKMTIKDTVEVATLGKNAKELQIDKDKELYYSADTIKELIKSKSGICLVAEIDNGIAGFAIRIHHKYFNEIYLSDLFVKEEFRKMGIGKMLFDESMKIAKTKNVDWAWALVQTENARMQRFLEKNGFKRGKPFYFYYKDNI